MDKQTKILPLNVAIEEEKEMPIENPIVGALLNTLSDIDQELDKHLNSEDLKS